MKIVIKIIFLLITVLYGNQMCDTVYFTAHFHNYVLCCLLLNCQSLI